MNAGAIQEAADSKQNGRMMKKRTKSIYEWVLN